MQRIILAIMFMTGWVFGTVVWAEQTNYDIGKVGAAGLKIPLGPRPAAMGEAFVALADDLNSTAWNPAGLAQMNNYQIGFMHNIYLQDTSQEYLAYAQNLFSNAGFGAYVTYFNYGKIPKYIEEASQPREAGDFTPADLTVSAGYGQQLLPGASLGVAVKFFSQNIDTENYSAFAVDIGGLVDPGVQGLQFGLAVQNLGTQIAEANLPMNAKVGAAYLLPLQVGPKDAWRLLADVNLPFGDTKYTSVNVGTEYAYNQLLALRLGYKIKDTGDLGGVIGLTAGVGAKFSILSLDYALLPFGDLGLTHQIMIAANF